MKIVIAGASTFSVNNLGDDAMFASITQAIRRVMPNSNICLLARHPSQAFDDYFGVCSVQNLEHLSNESAAGRIFMGLNRGDNHGVLGRLFDEICEADILLLAGNLFMEVARNEHLRGVSSYASFLTVLAQVANTPVAVIGLNVVDPIRSELTKQHIQHVLNASLAIGLREESAAHHLRDAGIEIDRAWVVGDPAVGLELPDSPSVNQYAAKPSALPQSRGLPIVSLCIRSEYWQAAGKPSLTDTEREAVVRLLESGVKLRTVPNCTYRHGHELEDDRVTHRLIFREFTDEIEFIENELGVYETVELLSKSSLHITNRRHSAILALHAGTAPIAVATSMATHMSGFLGEASMENALAPDLQTALRVGVRTMEAGEHAVHAPGNAFRRAVEANRAGTDAFLSNVLELLEQANQDD